MNTLAENSAIALGDDRHIGDIPVRNLWLLILYASDLYRELGSDNVAIENNPEDIADLVAEMLCHQVEKRLKRNLSFGYKTQEATINRVRGRIDILHTERHRLLDKGKVRCRFEELTVDTPRNRYIRSALEQLKTLLTKKKSIRRCHILIMQLERMGVSRGKPVGYSGKSERLGRHGSEDKRILATADLAFSLALPTEFIGHHHLALPDKGIEWLRKLFEKGVAGFYETTLDKAQWKVKSGKQFKWQISDATSEIKNILPQMKTDIIIDNKLSDNRLVIDTKFNAITKKGWYRSESLRSGYIYQMYAYLRSQENINIPSSITTSGMLLHPSIESELNEAVTIQGHEIRFCTVNLGNEAIKIKKQLLSLIEG